MMSYSMRFAKKKKKKKKIPKIKIKFQKMNSTFLDIPGRKVTNRYWSDCLFASRRRPPLCFSLRKGSHGPVARGPTYPDET